MITLHKGQYLSDVMKERPSNCILSKRIPGCGATTLELETDRNSIIVVPNVPVIISKCNKYSNLLGVYEKVGLHQIIQYLTNNPTHKIMTTPESFDKVKSACEKCGINIFSHFFLLMDECHQLVKDTDYRIDISRPMVDFFLFNQTWGPLPWTMVSSWPPAHSSATYSQVCLTTSSWASAVGALFLVCRAFPPSAITSLDTVISSFNFSCAAAKKRTDFFTCHDKINTIVPDSQSSIFHFFLFL